MTSDDFRDDFDLLTAMQNAKARAEDLQRHNDAIAERDNGFRNRHSIKGDARTLNTSQTSDVLLNALERAMQDPDYANAYNRVVDLLSKAEAATENALAGAKSELNDMIDDAAKLPDGRAVFMDKNGDIWTEDGERVDPDIAQGIQWPDNAPGYEDYLKLKKRVDDLNDYMVTVIGGARDRMSDPENPPSKDELDQIEKDIIEQAPDIVRQSLNETPVKSHSSLPTPDTEAETDDGSPNTDPPANNLDVPLL